MGDPLGWVGDQLDALHDAGLHRVVRHRTAPFSLDGAVDLSGNDYLALARDPRLARAAARATAWGAGAGASRLVVGGSPDHHDLEADIARWKGVDDAVVLSSGYLANVSTIQALVGPGDLICSDALNHASIIDGCRLSGAQVQVIGHRDVGHLREVLEAHAPEGGRTLVVTDGVFSMDGDTADLPAICDVAEVFNAMVMVDDAHGSGVLGPDGRGTAHAQGVADRVHVHVGTLSKAVGAAGGWVGGRADLVDLLRNTARGFIFDTAPPPAVVGAAREGVALAQDEPDRRERALTAARRLADGLGAEAPAACIVPLLVGDADRAMALAARLQDDGFTAVAIRPPSVPPGTARLRLTTHAGLTDDDVDRAVDAVLLALADLT